MPAITRLGDVCTGHGCFGSRASVTASENVFVNGIPVHRLGDAWESHCCGPACHGGELAGGSGTVFINGLPCGRVGDPVDCGSEVATGSENVFAGG
jgi:uncharacterized Zn-binding protein involved in type VI secretion